MDFAAAVPAAVMAVAMQAPMAPEPALNDAFAGAVQGESATQSLADAVAASGILEAVDIAPGAVVPLVTPAPTPEPEPTAPERTAAGEVGVSLTAVATAELRSEASLTAQRPRVTGRIGAAPRGLRAAIHNVSAPIAPELEERPGPDAYLYTPLYGGLMLARMTPPPTTVAAEVPFAELIEVAANAHSVEPALVAAVIKAESAFNPRAVSPVGARGLMQIMPGTARGLGVSRPHTQLFDPMLNIDAGTRYLRQMLDQFGDTRLALAAYNAGPGAVRRYGHRIPPFRETRTYVRRVLEFYERLGGVRVALTS